MRVWWRWVLAVLLVAGAGAVWLWLRARKDVPGANRAMADIVEAWTEPKIAAKQRELDQLKKDLDANGDQIATVTAEVNTLKSDLQKKYVELDLSPAEMVDRFKNLRV